MFSIAIGNVNASIGGTFIGSTLKEKDEYLGIIWRRTITRTIPSCGRHRRYVDTPDVTKGIPDHVCAGVGCFVQVPMKYPVTPDWSLLIIKGTKAQVAFSAVTYVWSQYAPQRQRWIFQAVRVRQPLDIGFQDDD